MVLRCPGTGTAARRTSSHRILRTAYVVPRTATSLTSLCSMNPFQPQEHREAMQCEVEKGSMWSRCGGLALMVVLAVAACGSPARRGTQAASGGSPGASTPAGAASPGAASSPAPPAVSSPGPSAGNPNGKAIVPAEAQPVDTSHPTRVIGTGTPASCTSAAVVAAVAAGGIVTFS